MAGCPWTTPSSWARLPALTAAKGAPLPGARRPPGPPPRKSPADRPWPGTRMLPAHSPQEDEDASPHICLGQRAAAPEAHTPCRSPKRHPGARAAAAPLAHTPRSTGKRIQNGLLPIISSSKVCTQASPPCALSEDSNRQLAQSKAVHGLCHHARHKQLTSLVATRETPPTVWCFIRYVAGAHMAEE